MTGRIQNKTIKKREEKKWVNEREIKNKHQCVGGCQAILHFLRRRAWRKRLCAPCPPPPPPPLPINKTHHTTTKCLHACVLKEIIRRGPILRDSRESERERETETDDFLFSFAKKS